MSASESLKNSTFHVFLALAIFLLLLALASTRFCLHTSWIVSRHGLLEIRGEAVEPGLVEQHDEEPLGVVDLGEVLADLEFVLDPA